MFIFLGRIKPRADSLPLVFLDRAIYICAGRFRSLLQYMIFAKQTDPVRTSNFGLLSFAHFHWQLHLRLLASIPTEVADGADTVVEDPLTLFRFVDFICYGRFSQLERVYLSTPYLLGTGTAPTMIVNMINWCSIRKIRIS